MRKLILVAIVLAPLSLLANSEVETDFFQRFVNFVLFASILYYLLADKLKVYFSARTADIQGELDKVQDVVKQSQAKMDSAKAELEESRKIANEIVANAKKEVDSIKEKVNSDMDLQIENLNKALEQKIELETKGAKIKVVNEVLQQLFTLKSVDISKDNLTNIILKKVA
jgi:F-type H+-transporting ATPase subunit b